MKNLILIGIISVLTLSVKAQEKKTQTISQKEVKTEQISNSETEKQNNTLTDEDKSRMKKTKTILINDNVFVQMVFKSAVQIVRSGAPEMALVKNEDNVVTIQALQEDVNSNISVKTADGLYYSYRIVSADNEEIPLFYEVPISDAVNGQTKLVEDEKKKIVEKMSVQEVTQTIYNYEGYIKNRNTADYRNIYITIRGVYVDKGKLFFLFRLTNKSNIDYKIERFQFFTMPVKKAKKKIENEQKEFIPLFTYKNISEIKAKSEEVIVAVFDQFTLNDEKKLQITMTESEGERTVKLDVDSKKVVQAKQL